MVERERDQGIETNPPYDTLMDVSVNVLDSAEHAKDVGEDVRDSAEHARDLSEDVLDSAEHARDVSVDVLYSAEGAQDVSVDLLLSEDTICDRGPLQRPLTDVRHSEEDGSRPQ